jgi:hypothetical protein
MVACLLISSIILLVYDIPRGLHFFAYILGGAGYSGQGSNFAWSVLYNSGVGITHWRLLRPVGNRCNDALEVCSSRRLPALSGRVS